jgi:PAS domain S-box-containing protein
MLIALNNSSENDLNVCIAMQIYKVISASLLLLLLLVQSLYAAESGETKAVLVLYSENMAHPAHELTDKGIRTAFRSNKLFDVELYTEYLDLARFSGPAYLHTMADYLRRKYADSTINAIIAVYPGAVDFLTSEESNVFRGVPIVACAATRGYADKLEGSPIRGSLTAVVMGDNISGLLDTALELRPGTKRVALVAGTSPNDNYGEQIFRRGLRNYAQKFELIDLTKLPMEDLLIRIGTLPPDTIVLYSTVFRDGAGKNFAAREVLSIISKGSNAPVFSLFDTYLGYGIVGGKLVSFEQQGNEAASLGIRILGGESPASIPFTGGQTYVSLYDWRELKRWNIPESAVPPGSEIRYRDPSFWDDYRREIVGVAVLIMVQTGLILGLVTNLRKRRNAEQSLIESEERVRLAVSSAGAGLWSLDTGTGLIWATDETKAMMGIPLKEEFDYEKYLSVVHPEDRELVEQAVQQAIDSEQKTPIEYRVVFPDRSIRWIVCQGRKQPTVQGKQSRLMGVCVDITRRKEVAEKLRKGEEALGALAGRLISAQEEERSRFARELHDDFTQRLAVLAIEAGSLELQSRPGFIEGREKLATIKADLIKISQDIHDLSRQLHPSILEDLGLVKAVQSECARLSRKEELDVHFTCEDVPQSIPVDIALALYRIIQAGLRNIEIHSKVRTAHILLKGSDGTLQLSIRDTGIGFETSQVRDKPGLGIASMKERTKLVGGDFSIDSVPGEGTVINVRIPLDEREI